MPKRGQKRQPRPNIAIAVICERVLEERDQSISLIRVINTINVSALGPETPAEMPSSKLGFTVVLSLRANSLTGKHKLTLGAESPSGRKSSVAAADVVFVQPTATVNLIVEAQLVTNEPGKHELVAAFDGDELTRIPLQVAYERQTSAS